MTATRRERRLAKKRGEKVVAWMRFAIPNDELAELTTDEKLEEVLNIINLHLRTLAVEKRIDILKNTVIIIGQNPARPGSVTIETKTDTPPSEELDEPKPVEELNDSGPEVDEWTKASIVDADPSAGGTR